jgi:hypothetical protein
MNFLQVVLDKQMLKWIFFVSALLFASSINAQESFQQIQKPVICGTQPDIFQKIQEAGEMILSLLVFLKMMMYKLYLQLTEI